MENDTNSRLSHLLLDSSLITGTNRPEVYNVKVIECGSYIQIYYLENNKTRKKKNNKELNIKNIDTDKLNKINNSSILAGNTIELKNVIRSKLECQRIAKCNAEHWRTFITLTFAENITDIDIAREKIKRFIYKVKRVYKDFMCLYIPEYQKRGAVHFHLLTNISIDNNKLIYEQEDNKIFLHVKYWNDGFTSVENITGDIKKIIGYISKYMTKDIDNRLFSKRRYSYTQNLKRPKTSYLNLDNSKHRELLEKRLQNKELIYNSPYYDSYNNELIDFNEYLTK